MRSYWAYGKFYVAAALDDLETVMSEEKPFCIMITHGLKSAQVRVESLLYTETRVRADKSIEYWEDELQPMNDRNERYIAL